MCSCFRHRDQYDQFHRTLTDDETSSVSDEESGTIEFRFGKIPSHDASLLLDSMILGLEDIEDSSEYESYIDIIFKEV